MSLTPRQIEVLQILDASGCLLEPEDLAYQLLVSRASAARTLRSLDDKWLVYYDFGLGWGITRRGKRAIGTWKPQPGVDVPIDFGGGF